MPPSIVKDSSDFQSLTYDRGFRTLFEDGVYLLLASQAEKDLDTANSLARGSIASTMMLPEVSANICIESLQLERSVFNEIDKLAPVAKFDFFLRTTFRSKKIPSGVLAVQKIQELKQLRNTFVHPKRHAVNWYDQGNGEHIGTSESTKYLDMSKNPAMWDEHDAIKAMLGAHEFLQYFFTELCGYSKKKVTDLLFSDETAVGDGTGRVYYYRRSFHQALKRWKIDISYFRIGIL